MTISPYFTTSLLPTGNRLASDAFCPGLHFDGSRELQTVEVTTTQEALGVDNGVRWIVGTPSLEEDGAFWLLMENGDQFSLGFGWGEDDLNATNWTAATSADRPLIVAATTDDANATTFVPLGQPLQASPWSAAVPTPDGGYLLVEKASAGGYQLTQLAKNGTDVSTNSIRAITDPLPDSMIALNSNQRMWGLYSMSTNVYNHAVLGDELEGGALTVLQWNEETETVFFLASATLEGEEQRNTVFEGLGPIWADVNGDGKDDLVTTISNSAVGARLRVYSLSDGEPLQLLQLAQAPAINLGGRWLHQLAVGPLGPNGETNVVEIRTPHIGGEVRYYELDPDRPVGDNLKLTASTSRYTSHDIRSRNLDRVVLGDFNGDGIPELVVQNQVKDVLVGLQRTSGDAGVEIVWSIRLPSPIESNLAVSCNAGLGIMEIMFATRSHQLVKAQFAPTGMDLDGIGTSHDGAVGDDAPDAADGPEDQPLEPSSDATPVNTTSGAYASWMGLWVGPRRVLGLSQQALLCISFPILLRWLAGAV